ncbi:MAG: glycogen debranching enzyme N-terminal domain-containing protein, partial [Lachnospiraceae bacterium]|nr:glycogen debranching enzyme N-terminal domain-containing protein [Lachnospiraceae bacterium]
MAINYRFGRGSYRNLEEGAEREWFIGNGLGGFSNISIIGNLSHVQSGYLVATLNPPVERINILSNIFDKVTLGDTVYDLSCQSKVDDDYEGFKYLESFELDSCAIYTYRILDTVIKKTICIEYGKNTVIIKYEIKNGNQHMKLEATPLFGMRDNNETDIIVEYDKDIDYSFEDNVVKLSNNKDNRYHALF